MLIFKFVVIKTTQNNFIYGELARIIFRPDVSFYNSKIFLKIVKTEENKFVKCIYLTILTDIDNDYIYTQQKSSAQRDFRVKPVLARNSCI